MFAENGRPYRISYDLVAKSQLCMQKSASVLRKWIESQDPFRLYPSDFKEVRCSFCEFSKPIRFCSNLVETFFNPFPIRKCKKNGGHHVGFQDGADQSSLDYTRIFTQFFSINSAGWKAMNFWVCSNIWANTVIVPEMIWGLFLLSPLFYR